MARQSAEDKAAEQRAEAQQSPVDSEELAAAALEAREAELAAREAALAAREAEANRIMAAVPRVRSRNDVPVQQMQDGTFVAVVEASDEDGE